MPVPATDNFQQCMQAFPEAQEGKKRKISRQVLLANVTAVIVFQRKMGNLEYVL